jgi:hypothetical protein
LKMLFIKTSITLQCHPKLVENDYHYLLPAGEESYVRTLPSHRPHSGLW